jgi:hypothetical protein
LIINVVHFAESCCVVARFQAVALGQYSELLGGRAKESLGQVIVVAVLVFVAGFDYRVQYFAQLLPEASLSANAGDGGQYGHDGKRKADDGGP